MFKILVSDKFSDKGLEIIEDAEDGAVDYRPGLESEKLLKIIDRYDGLLIRSNTMVTKEVLEKSDRLKVVGRAGVGVDNIDLEAATRRGVCVMNTPGGNNRTTAEHTIAMLLALSRNIPAANGSIKSGKWEKPKFIGTEIRNKTLGVIGLGNIGKVVASLGKGLAMKVMGYDPFISDEKADELGINKVGLDDIFKNSDYITVHVPKNEKTTGLIDKNAIEMMKDGVRIVNCARGGIVDEEALLEGLDSGKIKGAALDVFNTEPPGNHPLFKYDNVVATPHLGASTREAQDIVAVMVAEQALNYLRSGAITNSVNVPSLSGQELKRIYPFMKLAGLLGSLLAQLAEEAPNEIQILFGGEASDIMREPVISSTMQGFMRRIAEVEVNSVNAIALAHDRGIRISEKGRRALEGFGNIIGLKATFSDGSLLSLQGARIGLSDLRLVRYNGLVTDIELSGNILIATNKDQPGVVGEVGTILGRQGVNIANLRLARKEEGGEAILIVAIDSIASKNVIEKIAALDAIVDVKQVSLEDE